MKLSDKNWYREFLCCPDCRADITFEDGAIKCSQCDYQVEQSSPVTIKPIAPQDFQAQLSRTVEHPETILKNMDISKPEISYDGPAADRDSGELISEMQRYLSGDTHVLDLGCGPKDQIVPVEYCGFKYVGVDYSNPGADILADAHVLPFVDKTFDCVLSYAVLEHLHNPLIALSEIDRVLKPGGVYIGTVSQGEPFHDSYFHHTAWGLISLVSSSPNLKFNKIWSSADTIASLSNMGRYPKVIKILLSLLDKFHRRVPLLAPRRMKWSEREKLLDKLHKAGSLCFVIQKDT